MGSKKKMFFSDNFPSDNFPLEQFTFDGIYSFKQLTSISTYSCRVKRSSDNAAMNVGFNDFDNGTILSWGGTATITVVVFYDQSGKGNDLNDVSSSTNLIVAESGNILRSPNGDVNAKVTRSGGVASDNLNGGSSITTASMYSIIYQETLNASKEPNLRTCGFEGEVNNTNATGTLNASFYLNFDKTLRFDGSFIGTKENVTAGIHYASAFKRNYIYDGFFDGAHLINNVESLDTNTEDKFNIPDRFLDSSEDYFILVTLFSLDGDTTDRAEIETILNNYYN